MNEYPPARLHAIIAIDAAHAVRCQHTGCGHKVYAAVHIVQEAGKFLVLGSSCFAKRYGGTKALGSSMHGTGDDRRLTDQERALLEANTAALITYFEEQELARLEQEQQRLAEQKAIAAVLGALDDKIELNRRMNATLEAMARALFQSWFVDFDPVRAKLDGRQPAGLDQATAALFPNSFQDSELGPIPNGWTVETTKAGTTLRR